jgi:thioester reductase-like protein
VIFVHELNELLKFRGANPVADQVDFRLIQQISIADLFRLLDHFERAPEGAVEQFRGLLKTVREKHLAEERAMMVKDRTLAFSPATPTAVDLLERSQSVLLTGGTGFLGPFLLKSLIEQTDSQIRALTRAPSVDAARERLRSALVAAVGSTPALMEQFDKRVTPVCGDLEKPNLALSRGGWNTLVGEIDTVYHNAATVNYLFDYRAMRAANVRGTNEVLRLAFEGGAKQFNYVSTTFIFGWATKDVLYESDTNADMELLDFGYSQSKWVAEQAVIDAARHGLGIRIFRPALITPSVTGGGSNFDITVRLLAFMVKHGVSVDALNQVSFVPADVAANNIVAIANQRNSLGRTFHVTRDEYSSMVDIIDIIRGRTGRRFKLFALEEFVPEVIRRCTRDDLLFPLLDFLIGSVDNISSMEFKRYDSSCYQSARNASPRGVPDPSLEATVDGILKFMTRTGIA